MMRRYEMLSSGGLRIVSAQRSDSGTYECLASKMDVGTSTAKCFLHVQGLGLNIPGSFIDFSFLFIIRSICYRLKKNSQ
jgi:hypothetical protein